MSNTSKQRKRVMLFHCFHQQRDNKNQDNLSVLNELGEPSLTQMPGHSFADDDDDDQEEESGDYASYFDGGRTSASDSSWQLTKNAAAYYEDPVTISVADDGKNKATCSSSHSRGGKRDDETQEQPQDEEFGKRVDDKENHDDGSSRLKTEADSLMVCCGMPTKRSYVVGGVIIILILVLGMLTAIGFAVVVRCSSSNNNNNNNNAVPSSSTTETIPTEPTPQCSTARCGTTWENANQKCGVVCGIRWDIAHSSIECAAAGNKKNCTTMLIPESCPAGEYCFSDLNSNLHCCHDNSSIPSKQEQEDEPEEASSNTSSITQAPTPETTFAGPKCASVRCGTSWVDATHKCGAQCLTQACPSGEACFAELETNMECCAEAFESWEPTSFVSQDEASAASTAACTTSRCGLTWSNANNYCHASCQSDDDCIDIHYCYADLTTDLDCCSTPMVIATTCTSSRCGFTWSLANSQCNKDCVTDDDCAAGQLCFSSLDTTTLECCDVEEEPLTSEPNEEPNVPVYYSCTTIRCGESWTSADSTCGPNCESDSDCTEQGHRCFADLTTSSLECCV